ncbi:hypothetical protein H2200_004956 [Cladophialophora chaetospira]|uniref:Uncharacterized protein n=1 Tax=Cladophialophora chaetospira TaxID=386627 RepID=A0AA38XE56_9EURO|nr:hypothetical protein H2200_004956 [Cladophialophora chaetospira]
MTANTGPKKSEDEAPKTVKWEVGETRPDASCSSSDLAAALNPVGTQPSAKEKTAAPGEKRIFGQVAQNEADTGNKPEGPKKAKITATKGDPISSAERIAGASAKNTAYTSDKKPLVPSAAADPYGPTVILLLKTLPTNTDTLFIRVFSAHITTHTISEAGYAIYLLFPQHSRSTGKILRDFLYYRTLPWNSSIVALKGKEAEAVGDEILSAYILADEISLVELQSPLISLYRALQPSEIEFGNPADALRHVMQTNLDNLSAGPQNDLAKASQKKEPMLLTWQRELAARNRLAAEKARRKSLMHGSSFRRDEARKALQLNLENAIQEEMTKALQEDVMNARQEEAKKFAPEGASSLPRDYYTKGVPRNAQQLQDKDENESHQLDPGHQQELEAEDEEEYLEIMRRLDGIEDPKPKEELEDKSASAPDPTEVQIDNPFGSDASAANIVSSRREAQSAAVSQTEPMPRNEEEDVPFSASEESADQRRQEEQQQGADVVSVGGQVAMAADKGEETSSVATPELPGHAVASDDLKCTEGGAPAVVLAATEFTAVEEAAVEVTTESRKEKEAEDSVGASLVAENAKVGKKVSSE